MIKKRAISIGVLAILFTILVFSSTINANKISKSTISDEEGMKFFYFLARIEGQVISEYYYKPHITPWFCYINSNLTITPIIPKQEPFNAQGTITGYLFIGSRQNITSDPDGFVYVKGLVIGILQEKEI